jgi:YYY domain-containing protein
MPPYDPWFAGGYLNYYYFGQFIVASLIRLTGTEPQVAYNLAVPLLFALAAAAAFSIVFNLAELTQRARGLAPFLTRSPVFAGLAAVVLVMVAGNIDGLVQLVQYNVGPDAGAVPRFGFDFWRSSRMMVRDSPGNEITEFPFFTFLFADLHPHLIAMPFALLAFGLALSLFVRAGQRRPRLETWGVVAVLGVTIGALWIINTWDFPTALLLAALLITGGELLYGRDRPVRALLAAVGKLIVVVVAGYVVFLPFHRSFELSNNGVETSLTRTEVWRYLAIHSVFLMAVLGWLAFEWHNARRTGKRTLLELSRGAGADGYLLAGLAVLAGATVIALAASGYGTVAFATTAAALVTVTAALVLAAARERAAYVLPVVTATLVALLLGAAVDIWTVKLDIGRQNTVFKFYFHAWTLFGLSSAYLLWLMGVNGKLSLRRMSLPRGLWLAGLAVLLVGVMVYPVLGTRDRLADRFDTTWQSLDGMEYMRLAGHFENGKLLSLRHDYDAIRWLQENVDGSPVIIEGLTDLYHWGNRVSVYTGLPSVIGWDWHQRQQRVSYAYAVTQRRDEVNRFFTDGSVLEAVRTLDRYGVRYVYVGQLEKVTYPADGLAKFEQMAAEGLMPAYQNEEVTIYEYRPAPAIAAGR